MKRQKSENRSSQRIQHIFGAQKRYIWRTEPCRQNHPTWETGKNKTGFPLSPLNIFFFSPLKRWYKDRIGRDGWGEWTADAYRQMNHEQIFWRLNHPFRTSKTNAGRRVDGSLLLHPWQFVCTCKIRNMEQKKRSGLHLFTHYRAEQMLLLLWLEKTVLAPTCAISSLLILTITVRRTRWSVGRRVLRVVTQAYQGDEETRLTEPRHYWPSNPLIDFKRGAHL